MNKLDIFNIDKDIIKIVNEEESNLMSIYKDLEEKCYINTINVLNAFKSENVQESDFMGTTGYGYGDIGRSKIDNIFARIFNAESGLCRSQFISGTHALTVCLFALLRPNDTLLSITGLPYDTLHEVIGIKDNPSSLKSFNINYKQIDLINNEFDIKKIKEELKNNKIKVIEIQRSKGYSERKSISITKIEEVIKEIRKIDKDVIIMVDNCYCDFVETTSPIDVGADIMVSSLMKNLGGGISPNGAFIVGKKELIDLCADRLNVPGEGAEVGPSIHSNKDILMGLYYAPEVVLNSLKIAALTSKVLERLGYIVEPKYNEERVDIVESIYLENEDNLIKYTEGLQSGSIIDSNSTPIPFDMPGYKDKIIMASGSFVQGSTIAISCDAPIRKPYILFQQGSITYDSGKIALMCALSNLKRAN